jgi:alpha-L-fucosidase
MQPVDSSIEETGAQRLSLQELQQWEALRFGMFISFGMSTFDGDEFSLGDKPSTLYAPDRLDVPQWIGLARDAGMKYAVLTAKHVAGHCLWPSAHNDYHVGTSGNRTDVVEAFVTECRKAGILPGLYYCSWDNHNRFGSATPRLAADGTSLKGTVGQWENMFATREYEDFQYQQMEELAAHYGDIAEWWIDIPMILSASFRRQLYDRLAQLQPKAVIVMNKGFFTPGKFAFNAWPSDVLTYETEVPPYHVHPGGLAGHQPWHEVGGKRYYLAAEVCDTVNPHWFWTEGDKPKSDTELLGQALLSRARGCNQLLDVGPDRHGLIPSCQAGALQRLRKNLDKLGIP